LEKDLTLYLTYFNLKEVENLNGYKFIEKAILQVKFTLNLNSDKMQWVILVNNHLWDILLNNLLWDILLNNHLWDTLLILHKVHMHLLLIKCIHHNKEANMDKLLLHNSHLDLVDSVNSKELCFKEGHFRKLA
jgi:hypothetical protein